MTFQPPTLEFPDVLAVGDSWSWYYPAQSSFPASSWTLSFGFLGPNTLNPAAGGWTITAQSNGTWLVQVTKGFTAAYTAGKYRWQAYVSFGTERYLIAEGWVRLDPNAAVATGDTRTHAGKMVALIEAALEGRATNDTFLESASIGGRSISKITTTQLKALLGQYRAELDREAGLLGGAMETVGVNFVPPSS